MTSNHGKPAQPEPRSRPATKVIALKIALPTREVDVPISDLIGIELVLPNGVPFPSVAVRNKDGTITRYLGFPIVLTDEESRIEVPS